MDEFGDGASGFGDGIDGLDGACRAAVERALVTPPTDPREHERALGEASRCLWDAVGADGSQAGLWLFLGEIELLRGDHAQAEQAYRSAVEVDPDDALGYSGLAHSCAVQGRSAEAEDWLEQGLRVEPTAVLYGQLGQLHLEAGRMEEAEGALRTGLALDGEDPELLFLLARFFARDDEEARLLLERAVEADPLHLHAWLELGSLRLSLEDLSGARECFEEVLDLAPDASDGYRELALLELESEPRESIRLARKAIELDRDDVSAWTVLGQAQLLTGERAEGERTLLTACAIEPVDPDGARAHWVLADVYASTGRHEDAIATLEGVSHFASLMPEIAADLGQGYAELGRAREARDWLQVALEHDVDDDESRQLLERLRRADP